MSKEKEIGKTRSSTESKELKKNEDETIPNPNFYFGSDEFMLENGDMYGGQYCCHKTGIIWREGDGIYITKDRHIYHGQWENDQLLNSTNSNVRYPTGEEYWGSIIDGKYNGYGTYILNNKLSVTSDFQNNVPIGAVTLTDYEGHLWKGVAEEDRVIFLRENHYYQSLPRNRGIGKNVKIKKKIDENIEDESLTSLKEITQDMVFKKSNKTDNDFVDMNSYMVNRFQKENVTTAKSDDIIPSEQSSYVTVALLKKFLNKEYRKQNVPIPVFTPNTKKIDDECLQDDVLQTEG